MNNFYTEGNIPTGWQNEALIVYQALLYTLITGSRITEASGVQYW